MEFKSAINRFTVVSYKVISDEVPEFLKETYESAISVADDMINGKYCYEDTEFWRGEMETLENYHVIELTEVYDVLNCFTDEEIEATIDFFNNTFAGDVINETLNDMLYFHRYNSSWVTEEDIIAEAGSVEDYEYPIIISDEARRMYFVLNC